MFYGTIESLLTYRPEHSSRYSERHQNDSPSLENLLHDRLGCLAEILEKIERSIRDRKQLSLAVVYRIYQHYCYLKSGLFELPEFETRILINQKTRLEEQLDRLKQEKRQENVQCWRDIAALEKEWRTWFKQYRDLKLRTALLTPERNHGPNKQGPGTRPA